MFIVEDFVGLYPFMANIKLAISPSRNTKDDKMNHFVKCCASLFAKILYTNNTATIAPLAIKDDSEDSYITDKANLPTNFAILGKWIVISGESWVFNKKDKGSSDAYARFRLKSQFVADDIINQVSFEFTRLGGSKINMKPMQALKTETPMMLLFVCNGTDQGSVMTDIKQILEIAHADIEVDGMMPEEFENRDIPGICSQVEHPTTPWEDVSSGQQDV
jgi:hypothetical protein